MVERAGSSIALMSIHPRWADAILEGTKTVELRRQAPKRRLSHLVIYSTSPVCRIVGWAAVKDVHRGTPTQLWNRWNSVADVTRSEFRSYFDGSKAGFAICLGPVRRIDQPLELEAIGLERPPQSFQYLNGNAAAIPGLEICSESDRIGDRRKSENSLRQTTLVG